MLRVPWVHLRLGLGRFKQYVQCKVAVNVFQLAESGTDVLFLS